MGFAWPAALLGLTALAIPLLIHLLARGEFKRIEVATTRFIAERPKLRWRRLKVSHPLLLALRAMLVLLCVFLIAEPFRTLKPGSNDAAAWTLVSTRIDASQARSILGDRNEGHRNEGSRNERNKNVSSQNMGDENVSGKVEARWLAPGFPSLEQPRPQWRPHRLASLLDAADKAAPDGLALEVVVPSSVSAPGVRRPVLGREVRWLDAGPATPATDAAEPIHVDIVFDPDQQQQAEDVMTGIAAWQDAGMSVSARTLPGASADLAAPYVVWLSSRPWGDDYATSRVVVSPRALLDRAITERSFAPDGSVALQEQRQEHVTVRITSNLFTPDGEPDPELARNLLTALMDPRLTAAPDDYPVSIAQLESSTESLNANSGSSSTRLAVTSPFLWLIALVAAIERMASAWVMRHSHDA